MKQQRTRSLELRVLQYALPGCPARNIAVLLFDREEDSLYLHFSSNWDWCDEVDAEIISALPHDLRTKAAEFGAAALLAQLDSSLSLTLRLTDPLPITLGDDVEAELLRLSEQFLFDERNVAATGELPSTAASDIPRANADVFSQRWNRPWLNAALTGLRRHRLSASQLVPAVASAATVLAFIQAGIAFLDNDRTPSQQGPRSTAMLHVPEVPRDLPTRARSPHIYPPAVEHRPIRATRRSHKARKTIVREFRAPASPQTETAVIIPDAPDLRSASLAGLPPVVQSSGSLALKPPQSAPWTRRVFGVLAYPLKKLGQSLAE
jgi:hypothetical protein